MGGWGATADRPGLDAMYSTNHGDTVQLPGGDSWRPATG